MYLELNYLYPNHPLFATPQAFWDAPFLLTVEMRDYAREQQLRELERESQTLAAIASIHYQVKNWQDLNPWHSRIRQLDAIKDGLTVETAQTLARLRTGGKVPNWVELDWALIEGMANG